MESLCRRLNPRSLIAVRVNSSPSIRNGEASDSCHKLPPRHFAPLASSWPAQQYVDASSRTPGLDPTTGRLLNLAGGAWSESHQGIDRRSGASLHRQRREGDRDLVTVQPPRRRDHLLEIEALHDVDHHPA